MFEIDILRVRTNIIRMVSVSGVQNLFENGSKTSWLRYSVAKWKGQHHIYWWFGMSLRVGWDPSNSLFRWGRRASPSELELCGNPHSSLLPLDPAFCSITPSFRNESLPQLNTFQSPYKSWLSVLWFSFLKWRYRGLGIRLEPMLFG